MRRRTAIADSNRRRRHAGSARRVRGLLLAAALSLATACASSSGPSTTGAGAPPTARATATPSHAPHPAPTATATHSPPPDAIPDPCRYPIGQPLDLRDPSNGAGLRVLPTKVTVSRTRLSSDHGYAPSKGFYVSVDVTLSDIGSTPVDVGPSDFYLLTGSGHKTTVNSGNSPFSGANTALDTTELLPGKSTSGPLTFDVASTKGALVYAPEGSGSTNAPVCSWTL